MDHEDILDAALEGHRGKPALVEVARRGGREPAVVVAWSTGRVMATVTARQARLRRVYGAILEGGNALRLDAPELDFLLTACRDWARRREGWAAFFYSSAGRPAGYGGSAYYQPPGDRGVVEVGRFGLGGRRGEDFRGKDEVVLLEAPKRVRGGTTVVAEIWRRGERFGPEQGSLVGVRYGLADSLFMDARREEAFVHRRSRTGRRRGGVYLESDEAPFVAALRRRLRRGRG